MIKIAANHEASLQTSIFLHGMNTSLITILLDVSGSFPVEVSQTVLSTVTDAIKMSAPNAIINVIQFDDKINCAHRVPQSALETYTKDHKILGGSGTVLKEVANELNGKTESCFDFEKRQGSFENTPILIISDGYFDPANLFDDTTALIQYV